MLMNIIHLLLGIILEAKGIKEHHWKPFIKQLFEKKVLMRCEFSTVDILLYGLGIMECLFPCLISFFFTQECGIMFAKFYSNRYWRVTKRTWQEFWIKAILNQMGKACSVIYSRFVTAFWLRVSTFGKLWGFLYASQDS